MDWTQTLKAVFALAIVLGLILGLAYIVRRYAPQLMAQLQAPRGKRRRLSVVETLVLDPARRLVLVRVDEEERLLLLGEGHELNTLNAPARSTPRSGTVSGADPAEELF